MAVATTAAEERRHRVTVEDLFAIQDDRRYELFDGEVYMVPPPSLTHQWVISNLFWLLTKHVRERGLGEVLVSPLAVVLGPANYVEPDLVFVARERLGVLSDRGVEGPPDLAVEILSDSDGSRRRDVKVKLELYERVGIAYYWIVDPRARTLVEHELRGGRYERVASCGRADTFRPACFPGLEIPLPEVWPPPLKR